MQAPGSPDEDTRNGFAHGGWAAPYAAMAQAGHVFGNAEALLMGRRTYEDFYRVWPKRTESPFTPWLNNIPKYVVSRTLKEPLPWIHSTLLVGDVGPSVMQLKHALARDALIMGSGVLVRSLLGLQAIDEYVLLVHPLVLGTGTRLFADDGAAATLRLVSSTATPNGVVVATYQPVG